MEKKYLIIAMFLLALTEAIAQNKGQDNLQIKTEIVKQAAAKSTADSSHIAVYKKGGWQSLVSHLTPMKQDSVLFELVLKHDRTIDLKQEQLVGRIKLKKLLPLQGQTITFKLIKSVYLLRIEPNGRCYLRIDTGALPKSDPLIIPIRAMYKLM